MSLPEIRMFNVQRGRDGEVTHAVICNGKTHFVADRSLHNLSYYHSSHCDGKACKGSGSEVLDISLLSIDDQEEVGLEARVPPGLVLVTKSGDTYSKYRKRTYSSGEAITPKQLEIGTLLNNGEGTTYRHHDYWSDRDFIYYVRNVGGMPDEVKVGCVDRSRTEKKLAKLRRGERKSEVTYEVAYLNERLIELMQLHRTPEVLEEIENVKELLRLAASLSVEASIEAAEGNEQIARELANARAREIGSELQQTRERLMLEKQVREEVRKELDERYNN